MSNSATPWTVTHQSPLFFTVSRSLLKFMVTESVMLSISSSVAPFSFCLQSFPASGSFSMKQFFVLGGQKYWSFSISPSNEYSGLISFRIDWFDLLAVQGTLKSLLQHHSSKASILQCSAFFSPILTYVHDYWKNHSFDCMDLCWQSDVEEVIMRVNRLGFFGGYVGVL